MRATPKTYKEMTDFIQIINSWYYLKFELQEREIRDKLLFVDPQGYVQVCLNKKDKTVDACQGLCLVDANNNRSPDGQRISITGNPQRVGLNRYPQVVLSRLLYEETPLPVTQGIIALRGRAFSGKTTVGQKFIDLCKAANKQTACLPFAGPLKAIAYKMGWDGQKDAAGRHLLQTLGSECGRAYNPFCWANAWVEALPVKDPVHYLIVDDLRFAEELYILLGTANVLDIPLVIIDVKANTKSVASRRNKIGAAEPGKHDSETGGGSLTRLLSRMHFKDVLCKSIDNSNGNEVEVSKQIKEIWNTLLRRKNGRSHA